MRLLSLLLLCISFHASAIGITFNGTWDTTSDSVADGLGEVVTGEWHGAFELGEAIGSGRFAVASMHANVGNCPNPQSENDSHIDPVTHIETADCSMGGPKAGYPFGFDTLSGLFFALTETGARLSSSGHSDLFLREDGSFSHAIYTFRGAVGTYGTYFVPEFAAQEPAQIPEPGLLPLLLAMLVPCVARQSWVARFG